MCIRDRHRGYRALVVDSDESNAGLFGMLGFDHPPLPLLDFVGGREGLKQKMGQPNIFGLDRITTADIPEEYILQENGLRLVAVGKICLLYTSPAGIFGSWRC